VVLLDEILKGTNSKDKTSGSKAVIRKMISLGGAGVIATHDLPLGSLEKELPGNVVNICFEAFQEEETLRFDYLLRRGMTQNMNATFLMKQMGIINRI